MSWSRMYPIVGRCPRFKIALFLLLELHIRQPVAEWQTISLAAKHEMDGDLTALGVI
jgi:hypothetical protein